LQCYLPTSSHSAKIGLGAVTTAEIANLAVTTPKIAGGAVTTAEIALNAVTTAELANNAVTTPRIANGAVTAPKLASGATTTALTTDNSTTPLNLLNPANVFVGSFLSLNANIVGNFFGNGAGLSNLNASAFTFGTVPGGSLAGDLSQRRRVQ